MGLGGGLLPPLVAELVMDIDKYSAGAVKAQATTRSLADSTQAMFTKVGKGAAMAMAGIAVASVGMAADFQAQMTRLYTAAGAPKQAVEDATGQVLKLGNAVGFSGTQIAEALYHPVSAGLDLATSLEAVKYSAQEAQISGSSLDDTTYALSSVMKAFGVDAKGAHNEMALLNSIVGQGDMRFQDFNASVANWAPTAAQMGISVQSMGAALAFLTDRGNSAESAATRVTMGLSMMATPSKQAATLLEGMGVASSDVSASTEAMTEVLKKTGITQNQLAQDLAKPDGIYVALTHLKSALHDAGIEGTEADSVLAKIFGGGRSDKAIMSLMQNLDGLKTKFNDIGSGVKTFDQAWSDTQATFSFKLKQLGADAENLGISLGGKLIPVIEGVIGWFDKNRLAVDALALIIGGLLTASVLKYAQVLTTTVATALAKTALGIKAMATASEQSAIEQQGAAAAAEQWGGTIGKALPLVGLAVTGVSLLAGQFESSSKNADKASASVDQFATAMASTSSAGGDMSSIANASSDLTELNKALSGTVSLASDKFEGHYISDMGDAFDKLASSSVRSVEPLAQLGTALGKVNQTSGDAGATLHSYDDGLAQMVSSGNADRAIQLINQIKGVTDAQGKALINVDRDFPDAVAALHGLTAQQVEAAGATSGATTAFDANSAAADENAKEIGQAVGAGDSLTQAINAANDAYTALTDNLSSSSALLDFRKDLLSVTDEINKNGHAFDMNSVKGIANMQAFDDAASKINAYRDAQIKAAGGTNASTDAIAAANKTAADQAQQLIAVWEQLTGNKKAVDAYATSIGLVPKSMQTDFSMPGLALALSQVQQIAQDTGATIGKGGSRVMSNAAGGYISGPGTGTSDSILSWVSNGEYVLNAATVSAVGRPFLDVLNGGGSRGGGLGSVGGGSYGSAGLGTPIVQVFLDGKPFAGAVRKSTLRYDLRNSGNGFSLSGSGQR